MTLPASSPLPENAKAKDIPLALLIHIAKNGTISINTGKNKETLDTAADNRKLPKLNERLRRYTTNARSGGIEPIVQIMADKDAQQQRIIDVLNTLAGCNIKTVTFTDLVDPK